MGLPKPDLVVFLQLRLAEAVERGGFGQERYEDVAFQERVLQCYYQLMEDRTLNWKVRVTLVPELHPGAWAPSGSRCQLLKVWKLGVV